MNYLQLYITISYNGFRQMVDINAVDSVKANVTDISDALSHISYDPENKNIFYLIKSTSQGVFVVILRTIPDQPNDHLGAWIFIPSGINVPDNDINEVVNTVTQIISNPKITSDDMNTLRALFDRYYEKESIEGATAPNYGKEYAHRFFGGSTGYTLTDLIGTKRYQTSYLPYAGVILADRKTTTKITGHNITDEIPKQMVRLFPPKLIGGDYKPMIFKQPFNKPYLVPLMDTVEIVWESKSSVDVHQSLMIRQPNMRAEPISTLATKQQTDQPKPIDSPKPQDPATVDTKDDINNPEPKPADDKSQDIGTKKPEVEAKDHKTEDTAAETKNTAQHSYLFEIPAKSATIAGMITFEVNTRNTLDDSPIDGYVCDDPIQEGTSRINYLRFAGGENPQKKLIWGIVGFVAGVLLTLLCTLLLGGHKTDSAVPIDDPTDSTLVVAQETPTDDKNEAKEATNAQVTEPKADTQRDLSTAAAINYLDTNDTWTKSDLESYPDLKGLYDDMNSFNHKRLYDHWATKLKESRKFAKIAEHARLGQHKKPRDGKTVYNSGNDQSISVRTYLNTIDP